MIEHENRTSYLQPFNLGIYARIAKLKNEEAAPLLDPDLLTTASHAYLDALDELRARSRTALRPGVRYSLARKILGFANFGERDRRSLIERALAHFP